MLTLQIPIPWLWLASGTGPADHVLGGRVDHMLALLQHLVSIDQHLFHLGCVNVDQGLDPAGEVGQHTLLILGILAAWLP